MRSSIQLMNRSILPKRLKLKKEDEDKDEEETKIIILQLKNSLNEMNVLERIRNKADRS